MPQEPLTSEGAVVLVGTFGAPPSTDPYKRSLVTLRTRLLKTLGSPIDVTTADLNSWINDGISELVGMVKLDELQVSGYSFELTPDVATYVLPDGVGPIRAAYISGATETFRERKLTPVDWHAWGILDPLAGYVQHYYRQGNLLAFWPRPDYSETVVLDFQVVPRPLAWDQDQILLDAMWEWPILNLAKYVALNDMGQTESAGAAYNVALASIRSKRSREAENRAQVVGGITIPRDWSDLHSQSDYDSENR